jgi:drug/metabolite transporter (DMT)-like permease
VANAAFLTSLYVIFTPFLLWAVYRERPRAVHAAAAVVATVGAFLLSSGLGAISLRAGDALETLGALMWAAHVVLVGKYASRFDSISFATGQFLVCGALNFAAGAFFEPFAALATVTLAGAIAYRALLSIAVGYTAQVWAQKFTSPTEASLIFALESVFAAAAAALVLGERLEAAQTAGCVLILAAAALSQLGAKA